jgi:hypothetical protein
MAAAINAAPIILRIILNLLVKLGGTTTALRLIGSLRAAYNPARDEICTMKKPSKTAAELEASIKVEMEDICDWPTDMTISVQPDGDSWKVKVVQEGSGDDADRREMVEQIAARLKAEYDLKG